jgi:Lon protease-like protein
VAATTGTEMPMFPLGTVLVPSMLLPLNVFEERYRRMVAECLEGVPEMGVVLIERGSEVGGGDVRTDVGTVARILEAQGDPDTGYRVAAVGVRRIRVERWLPDDPYPRAAVRDWPDDPPGDGDDVEGALDAVLVLLRRALALQAELGEPGPPVDVEVSPDPTLASHQVTALAPLGPLDRQVLLRTAGPTERLAAAATLLDDAVELLQARLSAP